MTSDPAIFELERFAWGAPDRLELSGRFIGLPDVSAEAPVLVVVGRDRVHRLPAVPDDDAGPPEEGRPWRAAFAWQDAPVAFDFAELQLGSDIVVELPKPDLARSRFRRGGRSAAEQPSPELRKARKQIAAKDAAIDKLRGELDAAAARHTEARAELDALRAELERTRKEAHAARVQLSQTRSAVDEARSEAEHLLGRLSTFRDAVEDRA